VEMGRGAMGAERGRREVRGVKAGSEVEGRVISPIIWSSRTVIQSDDFVSEGHLISYFLDIPGVTI